MGIAGLTSLEAGGVAFRSAAQIRVRRTVRHGGGGGGGVMSVEYLVNGLIKGVQASRGRCLAEAAGKVGWLQAVNVSSSGGKRAQAKSPNMDSKLGPVGRAACCWGANGKGH
jgi:hypothetical protein